MKNKTKIIMILSLMLSYITQAQVTESFESYTLTPNFFYQDNNGTDWRPSTTKPMTFEYGWENSTWTSGSVYTNIQDTIDVTTSNLYACASYTAYDGSNYADRERQRHDLFRKHSHIFKQSFRFFYHQHHFCKKC
jgi:hypothetical protein